MDGLQTSCSFKFSVKIWEKNMKILTIHLFEAAEKLSVTYFVNIFKQILL